MTTRDVGLLAFVAGVAIGVLTTHFYMKDKCEQYIHEECSKFMEEKRASEKANVEEEIKKQRPEDKIIVGSTRDLKTDVRYHAVLSNGEEVDMPIVDGDDIPLSNTQKWAEDLEKMKNDPEQQKIFIISEDDYIDGFSGVCDQSALTYYKGDYELVDEHDELMIDVDRIVGIDNINRAIEEGLETVYIRNLYFGIDYEVTIVEGSYHRLHFDGDYEDPNDWED